MLYLYSTIYYSYIPKKQFIVDQGRKLKYDVNCIGIVVYRTIIIWNGKQLLLDALTYCMCERISVNRKYITYSL